MNGIHFTTILYGLAAAIFWGAGDFNGGLASKRANVFSVVIGSQALGGVLLLAAAPLLGEPLPAPVDLAWGALAGIAGAVGLLALYRGLAAGRMGLVAPLTAVIAALIPLAYGAVLEGSPEPVQQAGFVVGLGAVWLLSMEEGGGGRIRIRHLGLPVLAGLGFGLFFILVDHVSERSVLWPLAAARAASTGLLLLAALASGRLERPPQSQWGLIALAGVLDTGGNVFFALSTAAGRLDVAAVISSLYPAATVLLAQIVLRERLSGWQWVGVAAALGAVALVAG